MPRVARVVTRYVRNGNRNRMEIADLATLPGVGFTNITEGMGAVDDGDVVVVEITGLTAAQLIALRARTDIIHLLDRDDDTEPDFADEPLTRLQIRAFGTRINALFDVSLAKIAEYLDENDITLTRRRAEQLIRRLCRERRNT